MSVKLHVSEWWGTGSLKVENHSSACVWPWITQWDTDWLICRCKACCTVTVYITRTSGVGCNAKARAKTNHPNHTTHTNTVWGHFCKPKWFGLSKGVWKHSWMPVFMCESSREMHVSAAKPHSHTNNQIWCRDVQPRYFPSADLGLFVVLHVYISACEHLTVDHRAVIVCVNVSVS